MLTSSSSSPPFLLFLVAWGLELLSPALDALLGFEDPLSTWTINTTQFLRAGATMSTDWISTDVSNRTAFSVALNLTYLFASHLANYYSHETTHIYLCT